ncbi:hypothetical protein VTH82DRAFT_2081 [Thermothelomyces myriococcoides]
MTFAGQPVASNEFVRMQATLGELLKHLFVSASLWSHPSLRFIRHRTWAKNLGEAVFAPYDLDKAQPGTAFSSSQRPPYQIDNPNLIDLGDYFSRLLGIRHKNGVSIAFACKFPTIIPVIMRGVQKFDSIRSFVIESPHDYQWQKGGTLSPLTKSRAYRLRGVLNLAESDIRIYHQDTSPAVEQLDPDIAALKSPDKPYAPKKEYLPKPKRGEHARGWTFEDNPTRYFLLIYAKYRDDEGKPFEKHRVDFGEYIQPLRGNGAFDQTYFLHDLEGQRPKGNPYLGGQNFSWCCLKAFENALAIADNGSVVIQNNTRSTIGASSIDELKEAARRNQFPCGARYNGDLHGAPVVAISYDFLVEQCPGWELSGWDNVNAWLHSLSGFLVPAVVFCLSVPRRRKIYIPSYIPAFLGALAAGLIVLLDTTIWLSMCFAFAGPMILSGLYEAMLDSRVLEFLREKIQNNKLSLDMRCRCLMLILIGNLDLALEFDHPQHPANNPPMAHIGASPWQHMEVLLNDDGSTNSHIARTKTRLRAMLHCQYSFGTVIGAPVIFFLGGFLFAFLSSLQYLGDEYIAESIAFGSWYMIIPHIAIVSGLLLAGNNPNILEGVFATERGDQVNNDSVTLLFGLLRFDLAYPSCYKVAWQWQRGHNKKQWIQKLLDKYCMHNNNWDYYDLKSLQARTNLSRLDWFLLLSLTLLLLGVPFVLAFLASFFTPQTGLSCRSGTFAVSFCVQVAQIILWLWAYAGPPAMLVGDATGSLNFFRKEGWLDRKGFYKPSEVDWLPKIGDEEWFRKLWTLRVIWCGTYYFLVTVLGFAAIFSSIGGTLMQIIGVYRNALCYINTQYWLAPADQKPMAVLSTNSEEMIRNAINHWTPIAITAIVFMTCGSTILTSLSTSLFFRLRRRLNL